MIYKKILLRLRWRRFSFLFKGSVGAATRPGILACMRFKKGLIRPPFLRAETADGQERHATWQETFFDLAFVAVIGQFSNLLVRDFTLHGLSISILLFIPMWWVWVGQVYYLSRFDSEDFIQKLTSLVLIIFVAAMGVAVPRVEAGNHAPFAICYTCLRIILVFQYLMVGRHVPRAKAMVKIYTSGFSVAALLWLVSAWVPMPWAVLFWATGIIIDFWTPFICSKIALEMPPDPSHVPERFGLFTIIVLGEAVIATVTALGGQKLSLPQISIGIGGLLMAFSVWWIYFEGVGGAQARVIKSISDVRRTIPWLYAHLPMQIGIVVMAAGIKIAMGLELGEKFPFQTGVIFASSIFVTNLMMHVIFASRLTKVERVAIRKYSLPHVVTTGLSGCLIPLTLFFPASTVIVTSVALSTYHVLLILRELPDLHELEA